MAPSTIVCCYRDCHRVVWEAHGGPPVVVATSGTCIACRRVALCLDHLESVRATRGTLACPSCGGEHWHVVIFEPATLTPERRREIEAAGGRVEERAGAERALGVAGASDSATSGRAPLDLPPGLVLVRGADLPPGARAVGADVILRPEAGGTAIHVAGAPAPLHVDHPVRSVAVGEEGVVVELEREPPAGHTLVWIDRDGESLPLANPHGLANVGPAFVGAGRVSYLAEQPDGRYGIVVARRTAPDRVASRRIGETARYLVAPRTGPLALPADRSVVLVRRHDDGRVGLVRVDLETGVSTPLSQPGPPPRALAGAADVVCWLDGDGVVHCARTGEPPAVLGRASADHLAVAPDGRLVAWVADHGLLIGPPDPAAPRTQRPAPPDLRLLAWR